MISLTPQVRLRFTGADRVRYLNGQVTNDVRKLQPGVVQWAGVTNHKGRLEALVAVHDGADGALYVDGPAALRDFLPARLEKYIIADEVVCEEVSEETIQAHFLEVKPELSAEFRVLACERYGVPGWDVWGPAALQAALPKPAMETAEVELLRVERGIPGWETELQGGVLLSETGLEAWAVDFHKGCYIGQEVISRLKSVGRVNRHLAKLISLDGIPPEAGWSLYAESDRSPCGELTSVVWHPGLQKTLALGYVRREHLGTDTRFLTGPCSERLFSQLGIRTT